MDDAVGGVPFDAQEAAGRRRRGLVIVAVIAAVGIPLTIVDWWSSRQVEAEARELAVELEAAAVEVDDVMALTADEVLSAQGGGDSPIDAALGHADRRAALAVLEGGVAVAYEVGHWLETRCVHLLLTVDEVRTDIEDARRCAPRYP